MARFFLFPFAVSGDRTTVPDPTNPYGYVSYEQGYGPDYSEDPGADPDAKNIERTKWNALFFDVTTALRQYQTNSVPDFITSSDNGGVAFSYSKYAKVLYDDGGTISIYTSLVDSNETLPTDTGSWAIEYPLTNGAKGDITVGTEASVWTISADAITTAKILDANVTLAKMANLSQYQLIGRSSSGAGVPQAIATSANVYTMLGSADNAAIRANIGLAIGSDIQAYNAKLQSISAVTFAANKMPYFTDATTVAATDLTAAARTVLDDATVAAMVDTLGGASSTGSGGLVRATSPVLTSPTVFVGTGVDVGRPVTIVYNGGPQISNTGGSEFTMYTYDLLADSFAANGDSVIIEAAGINVNNANAKTFKIYFGSAILTVAFTANAANRWYVRARVVRRANDTQEYTIEQLTDGATVAAVTGGALTEDEEAAITIKATVNSVGTGDVLMKYFTITYLPAN